MVFSFLKARCFQKSLPYRRFSANMLNIEERSVSKLSFSCYYLVAQSVGYSKQAVQLPLLSQAGGFQRQRKDAQQDVRQHQANESGQPPSVAALSAYQTQGQKPLETRRPY
jgi:hypothetical protein